MLKIKSLNLNYGASQALRGVSLSAKKGEVTVSYTHLRAHET